MNIELDMLANIIVNYSLKVDKNDRVLITYTSNQPHNLVKKLIEFIYKKGGIPFVKMLDIEINALIGECTSYNRIIHIRKQKEYEVNNFDCFINIRYIINDYEEKNISKNILKLIGEKTKDLDDIRINKRRWVLLNYPSNLDAYKLKMKIDEFYNYAMRVMTINYHRMAVYIKPLKVLMESTDKVKITAPNTDIVFSIKDMPIIPCTGERNIPDGEIFVAPIKDTVNGIISFNTNASYQGNIYKNISLIFKNGKIIKASAENNERELNQILDSDEGSRYIGEFAIGLNPKILHPMGDILYDEKILGSIHLTPGRAYKESYNGNDSILHWDMILILRKEYGGGEMYFDNILISKDGFFVLEELKHLNYNMDLK